MRYAVFALLALALVGCLVAVALVVKRGSRDQRAQNYYESGMSYLAKQDFVKARIELRNAVQLKDKMVEAWRGLTQIDEHDRNWPALTANLRRVVEFDPKDVEARLRLARLLLVAGNVDQALKMTDGALELEPQNAGILALKSAILFRLKDTDGAIRTAQQALEIEPQNADANVVLAVQKFSQGDPDGALRALANVSETRNDDLGILFLKINIFDRTGDLAQAEGLLRKLIDLYPKEPAFRAQLIRFLIAHKRPDDAIKEQRAVVAADPADSNAGLGLVSLLGTLEGPAAARNELVARIDAGGKVLPYKLALARFDFAQGNVADSTKLLEQIISSPGAPEDIQAARTALAEMDLSQNNVAAAEPLITDILRQDGRNTNGLRLRASIRIDRGQIEDAIADLRAALNDQPRSPELLASLAIAYERSGSIELADKALFDATKASNYAPTVGLNYAAFLRRRGLNEQAANLVTDLANRNPNSLPVLSALAQLKLARQDWAGAHEVANAIRRLDDKSDVANQINATAFSGEKKFDDSLAILQGVYAANPNAVQPMAALVGVYLQSQQVDKAEALVNAALKANPDNAEALVLLGSIALAKNDSQGAATNFLAAINQKPKDIIGYRALADLYIRQNKQDDALSIIRAGLGQQPQSFALRLTLAGLLELKRDYDAAIAEYETMLKEQPGSMIVANNLASMLADHRTDQASLERANSLAVLLTKSQIPQFKDTLGWVAYQRGNYTAAVALLESAVRELPNVAMVHYHLGMGYLSTKQGAKASEQFDKARALAPNDTELQAKLDAAVQRLADTAKN